MEKANKAFNYIIITICTLLSLVFLFPIYILFINSFKGQKGIYLDVLGLPGKFFTWANYPDAFERMQYLSAFKNSLYISVVSTIIIVICSSYTAWILVRSKSEISDALYMCFAMSMLVPFQCVMIPLTKLMKTYGLANPTGLIFTYLGFGSSLAIMLFHGFIKNIPLELEEAATIDGCDFFRLFWNIVFPLLKTIIVTVMVLDIMWIWNDYLLPALTINAVVGWQTLPLKTYLFFGQFSKRWDLGTAALIMGMFPIVVFYLFAQKQIVSGITDGAIK